MLDVGYDKYLKAKNKCNRIFTTQLIGAPLYFINKDLFYAYMAMTKRHFGIVIPVITQIWGPTTIRISGDASVAGQIKPTKGGGVEFNFPERMVLIANHQVLRIRFYSFEARGGRLMDYR